MKKILLLDNYDSFTFNLVQMVEELAPGAVLEVCKNDQISLEEAAFFDKILLSPGAGLPAEAGIMPALIQRYASEKSILGICLGHQALGEAFGAHLVNLSKVLHGQLKKVSVLDKTDYLFQGIPEITEVGLYHSWVVSQKNFPDCLQITAVSEGLIMGLKHRLFDLRGLQFHPESVMTSCGRQLLHNWLQG